MVVLLLLVFCLSDISLKSNEWNMIRANCLVGCVFLLPSSRKVLGLKPISRFGKISMNIYLLHMMVLYMITCRMADALSLCLVDVTLMFAVTLVVTTILAYGYTKYVEVRVNKLTDKVLEKIV